MDEPVTDIDIEDLAEEHQLDVFLWDGPHGRKGISMQTSKDSWIAMRDGLDLRKWA